MPRTAQKLLEKYVVTEAKDGCIFKTKSLGEEWVPMTTQTYFGMEAKVGSTFYTPVSTKRMRELNFKTTRIMEIG